MTDKYQVILIDPPWSFRVWDRDTGHGRSAESHYDTWSLEELAALDVGSLADKDCALFMWAVWPSIFENIPTLLNAWGFIYKTCAFVWVKARKRGNGFFTGMGYYSRANTEPCLLAERVELEDPEACLLSVRGRAPVAHHDVSQIIYSPVRIHSQKPDEQYEKIERLYPEARKIELFATQRRTGWDSLGHEINGRDIRDEIDYWKKNGEFLKDEDDTAIRKIRAGKIRSGG